MTTKTANSTNLLTEYYEQLGLLRVDEATAVVRPPSIASFYLEDETIHRAEEQLELWDASGTAAARPADETVGRLAPAVASLEDMIEWQRAKTTSAMEKAEEVRNALGRHVRRPAKAKHLFYAKMAAIFLGDIAGIASATILFGLVPWMAVVQAVSVGGAAVAAGGAGAEFKDLQLARKRQMAIEDLPEDLQAYPHYFRGPDTSEAHVKVGIGVASAVVLLIFGGVFALQAATDSLMAGMVFGCLGAAVGLASFVNYWAYTDDVADHVERAEADAAHENKVLTALTESPLRMEHGEAAARAESERMEHAARGKAAKQHLLALGKMAMSNNPGVVGHGTAAGGPSVPEVDQVDAEAMELAPRLSEDDLDQLLAEDDR